MIKATTDAKVQAVHLRRQAIVYIRQSSAHQIRSNRESSQRQYALVERAKALGWSAQSTKTIDEDQGRSGTTSIHREGFKKLLAEVGAGQVGVVLALEASRLARSNADWHRLVEICVVTQTLLADETAVYDPREPNDRLLLGVKGTISEAELFTLRCRLHDGRWNKAKRGELARSLPVGYVCTESAEVAKDPDRQVQQRIQYVFRLFTKLKVARRVVAQLAEEKLKMPTKTWGGSRHGDVTWKEPDFAALMRLLKNPIYAGAYVYGQYEYDSFDRSPTNGKAKVRVRPIEDWPVCLQGVFPAYISWDQFVETQRLLRANWYRHGSQGAPRKGKALLQGIVYCGRCGAKMTVYHFATKEKRAPGYGCVYDYNRKGSKSTCQMMSSAGIDEAVATAFLHAVSPAKIDIALQALKELESNRHDARAQLDLQIQQAEYDVELARRRYEASDPENRLVSGELESLWEEALHQRAQLERERDEWDRHHEQPLLEKDRQRIKELSGDLARVWNSKTTSMEDRKMLLRFLVKRVHVDGVTEEGRIRIEIEWHTGARTSLKIDRPLVGVWAPKTPKKAVERIRELLPDCDYTEIATKLNEEGFQSAKGLPFNYMSVGYVVRSRGWNQKSRKTKPR